LEGREESGSERRTLRAEKRKGDYRKEQNRKYIIWKGHVKKTGGHIGISRVHKENGEERKAGKSEE